MEEHSSFIDHNCEKDVISMLLNYPSSRVEALSVLVLADFDSQETRDLFNLIKAEFEEFGDVDKIKVYEFGANHSILISDYFDLNSCPTDTFLKRYVKRLKDLSQKRQLQQVAAQITASSKNRKAGEVVEQAMQLISQVKDAGVQKEDADVKSIYSNVLARWEATKGQDITGIESGVQGVNRATAGYQGGHFWLVAGYTNYGKSTLLAWMAAKLIKNKTPIAVFSTEMSQNQTLEKIISQYCGEGVYKIRNNVADFEQELGEVSASPLRIYTQLRSVEAIRLELISLKMQGLLPPIVFIDFVQNLDSFEKTEYEKMTAVAKKLQSLGLELNICLIVASQISNEGAANKSEVIPVKGSGGLTAAADVIAQIFRNKKDEREDETFAAMNVQIRKNRHGEVSQVLALRLNKKNGVLDDLPMPKSEIPFEQTPEFWNSKN